MTNEDRAREFAGRCAIGVLGPKDCSGQRKCGPCFLASEIAAALDAAEKRGREEGARRASNRPRIVCLCGSTRFIDHWNEWRKTLTLRGEIVLAIEIVTTQRPDEDPQHVAPEVKARLDELHKRKIDLADYVFVLDVGGYIGASTRSEIEYATALGKPVQFLSAIDAAAVAKEGA